MTDRRTDRRLRSAARSMIDSVASSPSARRPQHRSGACGLVRQHRSAGAAQRSRRAAAANRHSRVNQSNRIDRLLLSACLALLVAGASPNRAWGGHESATELHARLKVAPRGAVLRHQTPSGQTILIVTNNKVQIPERLVPYVANGGVTKRGPISYVPATRITTTDGRTLLPGSLVVRSRPFYALHALMIDLGETAEPVELNHVDDLSGHRALITPPVMGLSETHARFRPAFAASHEGNIAGTNGAHQHMAAWLNSIATSTGDHGACQTCGATARAEHGEHGHSEHGHSEHRHGEHRHGGHGDGLVQARAWLSSPEGQSPDPKLMSRAEMRDGLLRIGDRSE